MPLLILGVIVIIACAIYINSVNKPARRSGTDKSDPFDAGTVRDSGEEKSKVIYLDDMKKKDK